MLCNFQFFVPSTSTFLFSGIRNRLFFQYSEDMYCENYSLLAGVVECVRLKADESEEL